MQGQMCVGVACQECLSDGTRRPSEYHPFFETTPFSHDATRSDCIAEFGLLTWRPVRDIRLRHHSALRAEWQVHQWFGMRSAHLSVILKERLADAIWSVLPTAVRARAE
jgi:hypothetical protein